MMIKIIDILNFHLQCTNTNSIVLLPIGKRNKSPSSILIEGKHIAKFIQLIVLQPIEASCSLHQSV